MGDVLSSLESMRNRRDDLIATISDTFCLLGPFRPSRIPLEILQNIFQIVVIDMLSSPYAVAAICRSWRRAALGTPAIWSRIALRPSLNPRTAPLFTSDGYEICHSRLQLKSALWRTRYGPLQLRISWWSLRENRARLVEMIPLIGGETSRRWQSIDLDISQDCDLSTMLPLFLSNLKHVYIRAFNASFFAALEDAMNLVSFSVTSNVRTLTVLRRSSIWPRLKALTIAAPIRAQWSLSETQALQAIVGSCLSLQSLTLHTEGTVFITSLPQLILPSLIFTTLLDVGPGDPCRPYLCTNLIRLVITSIVSYGLPIQVEEAVILPRLTHLTLHGGAGLGRLPGFVCPSLDTPNIFGCDTEFIGWVDDCLNDIWIAPIGPGEPLAPRELHLRRLDITPSILCACLSNMARLEELRMEGVHMPTSFFAEFLGDERVGEGQEPMYPKLRYFEYKTSQEVIGTLLGNSMETNAIEAIVKRAMDDRKDSGKRLQVAILDLHGCRTEYRHESSSV